MSDIVFELLKLVVMVAALVVSRYLIPWIKTKVDADKLAIAASWVKQAVLSVQQTMWADSGEERKAKVIEMLKELLIAKNISLTDTQLDTLIEAAVKQMKIEEKSGVTDSTTQKTE